MSGVAVLGSAEIDLATIDGSHIGAVIIQLTEGAAALDTIPVKYKSAMSTKIEGQKQLDSFSKFKNAFHTDLELCANLDSLSKFKQAFHIVMDKMGLHDTAEFIFGGTYKKTQYVYPAIRVQNDSR